MKRKIMSFEDNFFPWYLQSSLNDLRMAGVCCDVVLAMNNKEWRAHKTVLSAASPYFCAMFNSEFREARCNRIHLQDVDSESLTTILEFIYSSRLKLTQDNVFQLMDASNYLQVTSIKIWINNYLHVAVSVDNCVGLYERSVALYYHDLANMSLAYIRKHFARVVVRSEFLQASGELLTTLLDSNFLNVQSENSLLRIVMRWINADARNRKRFTMELMDKLELRNIQLQKLINLRHENIFREDNDLQEYLNFKIAEWQRAVPPERSMKWKTVRYGAEQGIIFAMGGEIDDVPTREVDCFTFGFEGWKRSVPEYIHARRGAKNLVPIAGMNLARTNAAVVCDSYNAYVLGGRSLISNLSECEYYNIKTNTWKNMTPLPKRLEGGSAVFFEGRIVFIGGESHRGCTNKVWQWEQSNGTWKSLPPLIHARSFHCSISYGGYIYTMGGFDTDNRTAMKSVERYDPVQGKWSEVHSMHKARAKFGCALVNNHIYVMGGMDRDSSLRSVEKYNLETNNWSYMSPMLAPRSSFSVAVYEKKIFCIGGTDGSHNLRSIDKYNPLTNRWHFLFYMQLPRCGLVTPVLHVPYITRDV